MFGMILFLFEFFFFCLLFSFVIMTFFSWTAISHQDGDDGGMFGGVWLSLHFSVLCFSEFSPAPLLLREFALHSSVCIHSKLYMLLF